MSPSLDLWRINTQAYGAWRDALSNRVPHTRIHYVGVTLYIVRANSLFNVDKLKAKGKL